MNQPIRIIDSSKASLPEKTVEKPVVVDPVKVKILNNSVNFGFSRRTRDAYITKELEKSALDSSVIV